MLEPFDDWDEPPIVGCPGWDMQVDVTDNPVTATLLDHHGASLIELRERPPIGFR